MDFLCNGQITFNAKNGKDIKEILGGKICNEDFWENCPYFPNC